MTENEISKVIVGAAIEVHESESEERKNDFAPLRLCVKFLFW